jgi:hypothetical protein
LHERFQHTNNNFRRVPVDCLQVTIRFVLAMGVRCDVVKPKSIRLKADCIFGVDAR